MIGSKTNGDKPWMKIMNTLPTTSPVEMWPITQAIQNLLATPLDGFTKVASKKPTKAQQSRTLFQQQQAQPPPPGSHRLEGDH